MCGLIASFTSMRRRGLSLLICFLVHFRHPSRKNEPLRYTCCGYPTNVRTSNALVFGFMTSPVRSNRLRLNNCRFQRYESSSSQLDSPTAERLDADWLCISASWSLASTSALRSTQLFYTQLSPRFLEWCNNRATQSIAKEIRCQLFYRCNRFVVAARATLL